MLASVASYLGGAIAGFAMGTLAMLAFLSIGPVDSDSWIARNLGHSIWIFAGVLVAWGMNLVRLKEMVGGDAPHRKVVQLDQLTDIWIHLFIGIGVVWTAIGMRAALETTLAEPATLAQDGGKVLARLVDGGILLALTTTIVGALGGYLMRLGKTLLLGADLAEFYHRIERAEVMDAMAKLGRIEALLASKREEDNNAVPQ